MRNKIYDFLTALLFTSGLLIAGGDSDYWPWHIPLGLALFGLSVIVANRTQDDTE